MGDACTSRTLVLLEDDPLQLQVLDLQLKNVGLQARCCQTPEQALSAVANAAPGALTLLMDVRMPQLAPMEFCRQVRALAPGVRIVGCSASQPGPQVLAAFDHFVLKPLSGPQLAAAAFPTAEAAASEINADTFQNLARSMSCAMLRSLFVAYFADAEQRQRDMDAALETTDLAAVKRCAHTLKGSSAMLGVQTVAQTAFALETLDSTAQAPQLLSDLRRLLAQARQILNTKLDTLTADVGMVPSTTDSSAALLQESKNTQ